jgi:hypothetical protein
MESGSDAAEKPAVAPRKWLRSVELALPSSSERSRIALQDLAPERHHGMRGTIGDEQRSVLTSGGRPDCGADRGLGRGRGACNARPGADQREEENEDGAEGFRADAGAK